MYTGCLRTASTAIGKRLPDFIVAGVQKGGTTSVAYALQHLEPLTCFAHVEMHFFDSYQFYNTTVNTADLMIYATLLQRSCNASSTLAVGEKTPNYIYSPHAALRLCEALDNPRLVLFLRDPMMRAYSSFYNGQVVSPQVSRSPKGFHLLAQIEVSVIEGCRDSVVPSGDPSIDILQSLRFRKCCSALVSQNFGFNSWAGCTCVTADDYHCTLYGDKRAAQVRMGIYVWQLRRLFRYHRASNVLLVRSEDFFTDSEGLLKEVIAWVIPSAANRVHSSHIRIVHANSKARGLMLNDTAMMLRRFYAPYNVQLEQLVGRKLW